jgi:hypothetical protein
MGGRPFIPERFVIGAPPLAPPGEEPARDHPGQQALGLVGPAATCARVIRP